MVLSNGPAYRTILACHCIPLKSHKRREIRFYGYLVSNGPQETK
jgi:hypothetical protein